MQALLAGQLAALAPAARTTVLVHGTDVQAARSAVAASGMRLVTTFDRIGVAVAVGTRDQVLICSAGLQPDNGPGLLDIGTFNTISGVRASYDKGAGLVDVVAAVQALRS